MISFRREQEDKLFNSLEKLSRFPEDKDEIYNEILDVSVNRVPYTAVTKYVYKTYKAKLKNSRDNMIELESIENFAEYYLHELSNHIENNCSKCVINKGILIPDSGCSSCNQKFIAGLKIHEHLLLAVLQMDNLYKTHEKRIEDASKELTTLRFQISESVKEVEALKKKTRDITSNYIAILGIFAAVLMGAFGGITSFTSLFEHLNDVALGTVLIVSGLGGLTVVSILFILLQSIAKLTDRSLGNFDNSVALYFRYPVITTSVLLLVTVSFVGAALNLSLSPPKYSLAGLWWLLPIAPVILLVYFVSKNKNLNSESSRDD